MSLRKNFFAASNNKKIQYSQGNFVYIGPTPIYKQ